MESSDRIAVNIIHIAFGSIWQLHRDVSVFTKHSAFNEMYYETEYCHKSNVVYNEFKNTNSTEQSVWENRYFRVIIRM